MDDLRWCINYLKEYNHINSLFDVNDFNTLRGLMNTTMPYDLSDEYYERQDNILKDLLSKKEIMKKKIEKKLID